MNTVARFEKVSRGQFESAFRDIFGTETTAYDTLTLPCRATAGSAGYDFTLPCDVTLAPGQTAKIPTGIRVWIAEGWLLQIFPRSGLGFKYRLQLDNTVGIIDSDYYGADNEGHIFIKITNDSKEGKTLSLHAGDAFAQGVFTPFGIAEGDDASATRHGGFGSTGA